MKVRAILSALLLCLFTIAMSSCGKNVTGPEPIDPGGEETPPDGFPPIPYPATPYGDTADSSEIWVTIAPIAGKNVDFAPVWETGRFTWNVDIQTQYERCLFGSCSWDGDAPGDYWNGTSHNSALTFEGGTVDLRSPAAFGTSSGTAHPKRVEFIHDGQIVATPTNPDRSYVLFQFQGYYPERRFDGALWGGYVTNVVDPAFGENQRRRAYYVAAMSAAPLTNPVYLKRERYWRKIPILKQGGGTTMNVVLDPGATFEVSYSWMAGTDYGKSYTFTRSVNGEVSVGGEKSVIGGKLGGSLSQAFTSEVHVTAEEELTVTKTLTGIADKTTVYSAWTTVERYTIVDEAGNEYTDPNFTFSDLGTAVLVGNKEHLASKSFPHETGASITQ